MLAHATSSTSPIVPISTHSTRFTSPTRSSLSDRRCGVSRASSNILTLNPAIGAYTYVNPSAIVAVNSWGQPINVNEAMYAYPNVLIMPASSGTNWWKAVFSPASFSEANLGMSGGSADNAYNVSFGYLKQNGTAAYSQFQRGTLREHADFFKGSHSDEWTYTLQAAPKADRAARPSAP